MSTSHANLRHVFMKYYNDPRSISIDLPVQADLFVQNVLRYGEDS